MCDACRFIVQGTSSPIAQPVKQCSVACIALLGNGRVLVLVVLLRLALAPYTWRG